jgi:exonuclease SbcC
MLRAIEVWNFQRHRHKRIELGANVTVIVGDNSKGKTAMAKAVRWVCLNQPRGDWMIRWGSKRTRVKLEFDGFMVERRKGKKNVYLMDGHEYAALETGKVPVEIAARIKMDAINFQTHADAHFWFSGSPGETSKELNRIVDLGLIDSSMGKAATHLRRKAAIREACESRVEQAAAEKKSLAVVPRIGKLASQGDDLYSSIQSITARITEAEATAKAWHAVSRSVAGARQRLDSLDDPRPYLEALKASRAILSEAETLLEEWRRNEQARREVPSGVPELGVLVESARTSQRLIDAAEEIARQWQQAEAERCEAIARHTAALAALERESGGRCPICRQPMKPRS